MNDLSKYIMTRRSVRKYLPEELSDDVLNNIKKFIVEANPLYQNIKTDFAMVKEIKGHFAIKCPHYIAIYSEKTLGYLENIGFIYQQVSLYINSLGYGCVWLGDSKPTEVIESINSCVAPVLCIGFGKTDGITERNYQDFKRKQLTEISEGNDQRLELARLAPSAMNSQNWYFIAHDDVIDVYLIKPNFLINAILKNLNRLDVGIALSHIYLGNVDKFSFKKTDNVKPLDHAEYMGTVFNK